MKKKIKIGIRIFLFLVLGAVVFLHVQRILTDQNEQNKLAQFYEVKDEVDVLAIGTSHIETSFSPMQIFEDYDICTYNLGSALQPIGVSYYLAKETIEKGNLKVLILDASGLYLQKEETGSPWRYVMDSLPYGRNKIEMAIDYGKKYPSDGAFSGIIPIYKYHDRWKQISYEDWKYGSEDYCSFGQNILGEWQSPTVDVDEMNSLVYRENEVYDVTDIVGGEVQEQEETIDHSYSFDIPEDNLEYLHKIKELCNENGVQFLLTKIPAVTDPETYESAWTQEKSDYTKDLCMKENIDFLDLLYDDIDYAVDYDNDFLDGGLHLNVHGAMKVSDFFGKYLKENYDIKEKKSVYYYEKLNDYDKERDEALLKSERDYNVYMDRLNTYLNDNVTLVVLGTVDTLQQISQEAMDRLSSLGLEMDFSKYDYGGYIAQIEKNQIQSEHLANGLIQEYGINVADGDETIKCSIWNSDWYTGTVIRLCDQNDEVEKEIECDSSNLSFVLYDNTEKKLLDAACFVLSEDGGLERVQ